MGFQDLYKSQYSAFRKKEEDLKWITVNGAHIPIRPGQSKGDAVKEHFASGKDSKAIKPEHIKKLHQMAAKAKEEIDEFADEVAGKYGARVAKAPLKKAERIIEKAINDHNGDISKVRDVARNTIVIAEKDIQKVVDHLKEQGNIVRHKKHLPSKNGGYSGHLFNFETSNGHVAEIQANTPQMIYAKEKEKDARSILGDEVYAKIADATGLPSGKGHEYYEKIRSSKKKRDALERASKDYYAEVRRKSRHLQI